MASPPRPADGAVNSVARAIAVLRALGDAPGDLTLGEISERSGVPRSSVHRIVQTLRQAGFVAASNGGGGVRLGPAVAELASLSRAQLTPLVRPHLEQLSRRLEEGASLAVLDGDEVRFLDQAITGQGLRAVSLVGARFPAHCTANGKALLAALPRPTLDALLPARLQRLTARTIASRGALLAELEEVRRAGVAFDREEHAEGICAVGRVVRDAAGNLAAVTVALPAARFYGREQELAAALTQATAQIDAALAFGHEPAA
ncbi:MAG TPA: IclR family transcriptional regulator [Conexibacter sp.]|jgi:DNA-binding IclR family transcriptional regulator